MGKIADIFSGKKKVNALNRLKKRTLSLAIAGATLLSPLNVAAQSSQNKDNLPEKTEIEKKQTDTQIQADSIIARFDDLRLKNAAGRMMKTETGRAVLTELAKKNIPVEISNAGEGLSGAYFPDAQKILIAPSCSDDLIASILIHEGTHAIQAANGCNVGHYLNARSYINLNKAMEADAMKNQLFAAAELKNMGDASVYRAFAGEHPQLVKSYESLCKQYGEQKDSIAKYTMLSYYNDRNYVKIYEDMYVKSLSSFYNASKKNSGKGVFQININEAEIIKRICHLNGNRYMNEADTICLQDSARNYVLKGTYNSLEKLSAKHADILQKNSFSKPDSSYKNFYVIDYKGRVLRLPSESTRKDVNTQQKSAKIMASRIKQKGR